MPKSRRKFDNQLSILDLLRELNAPEEPGPAEGRMRCIDDLRGAIRRAIKTSPLSRHQIAGQMSHLLAHTITKEMIDSWTRESDEVNGRPVRHVPAEYLPAFCDVTGSTEPLRILGELCGLFVLPGPDALRAEIQRLDEQAKQIQARKRKRVMFLKEIEQ